MRGLVHPTMFGLLFEEFPTYEELANGTPKLSLVFEFSRAFAEGKTRLVASRGIASWVPVNMPLAYLRRLASSLLSSLTRTLRFLLQTATKYTP